MKLELEQVYKSGKKTIIEWTDEDTQTLYNATLEFMRRFNPWIMRQSESTQTLTMLEFGEEYERLLDALKVPEIEVEDE
jgi:hypothetical protein